MTKIYFLQLIIFFIFPGKLFSQVNISGQIIDKNNKLFEFLEVQLQNKDSIIIKSELTNVEGKFTILTEKGEYKLLVKQLGKILYKAKISANKDINVGVIQIKENQLQLNEVVVEGKKKLIERKVDRLVFNVENSISATGGDAIDALKVTPGITVNSEQISIIGKSNLSVMLNDKLINLSGADLINFLNGLKSDDIKKIEVITSPPARYDAQGNSGLINIVTKSVKSDSFNGSVRGGVSQSNKNVGSGGINLNYQKNKSTQLQAVLIIQMEVLNLFKIIHSNIQTILG